MGKNIFFLSLLCLGLLINPSAAPVVWVDWTSGTAGANGVANGTLTLGTTSVNVNYSGEIAFIQTSGGINYWTPSGAYLSTSVDNAPATTDIIALSYTTTKTITFSQAVDNLFFAFISLNVNGYQFNRDFEIVSCGTGYCGSGTLSKTNPSAGVYQLNATSGEPHGVIRFTGSVTSITWTSLINEYWNGFTVGTYGLAPVPELSSCWLLGIALIALFVRLRRQ